MLTNAGHLYYRTPVKFTAVLIVAVLACSALVPGAPAYFSAYADAYDETPFLRTLDVCHASSGGMSFDLPYLLCRPAAPLPMQLSSIQPLFSDPSKPILLVYTDERPPKPLL